MLIIICFSSSDKYLNAQLCQEVNDFSASVVLSNSQAPGVWYVDRFAPYDFVSPNGDIGGSVLKHSINVAQGAINRPGGQQSAFYNTQGRKLDQPPGVSSAKIDLYIPASWENSNKREAGFWATAVDASDLVTAYPIIEFSSEGGTPQFRGYEVGTGTWINMGLPIGFVYDSWVTLEIILNPDGEFTYHAGDLVETTSTGASLNSIRFKDIILQGHNYDPNFPVDNSNPGITYDIYWDNFEQNSDAKVYNVTDLTYFCSLQSAINAASAGDQLQLLTNISEGLITVNKSIEISGDGYSITSTSPTWGMSIESPNVTISDLTVTNAGTFGFITGGCASDNLTMTNVTASDNGGTGFAINGVDNVLLTDITATNNIGNGISITDCNNVTINGITTSGNAFGGGFSAGVGIFSGGACAPPAGTSNVVISGTVSISEPVTVYEQAGVGSTITGTMLPPSLASYFAGVGNGVSNVAKYYAASRPVAYVIAATLIASGTPTANVYVEEIATGNTWVDDALSPNPPLMGSYTLSINAAKTYTAIGKTVNVEAGTFTENISLNKAVTLAGPNAGIAGTGIRSAEAILSNSSIVVSGTGPSIVDGFHILNSINTIADVILMAGNTEGTIRNSILERVSPTAGDIIRAITTSAGSGVKTIENNWFTGDASGGLFGGHKTWNSSIYVNAAGSTVNILNNTFTNSRSALNLDDYNAGITVSGNTFDNDGTFISFGGVVPTAGNHVLGANEFKTPLSATINLSNVATSFRLDMTTSTFNGALAGSLSLPALFTIESTMYHRGRGGKNGLVYYKEDNQFVVAGLTTIQSAEDYAAAGDTINVAQGVYNEMVTINVPVTIDGQTTGCSGVIIDGQGVRPNGIVVLAGTTNVTLRDLAVRNINGGSPDGGVRVYPNSNNLLIENMCIHDIVGRGGIFIGGPIADVGIINNEVYNTNDRGIVIWDQLKSNINISNNSVHDITGCCGIELQDGTATGVTMNANSIVNVGDSGLSVIGLTGSGGPNSITSNIITNTGRFGIELKNPDGDGSDILVTNNNVSHTMPMSALKPGEVRDIGGIVVIRRAVQPGNVDVPTGVRLTSNTVSGFVQDNAGNSEGFGIVIEGTNHYMSDNTTSGNDVGLQQQAGHAPYPGDGNQADLNDEYFGRGNSPVTCSNVVDNHTYIGNSLNYREVGTGGNVVVNTTTNAQFCTIQAAINDPATLDGHTIFIYDGIYNERVVVSKDLTIQGESREFTIIDGSGLAGTGSGITLPTGRTGVTIQDLTVRNFVGAGPNTSAGIYCQAGNNNLEITNVEVHSNSAASGIYANGPVDNVTITGAIVHGHTNVPSVSRGIVIWNGHKSNITITDCEVYNNNCCGIELQDGTASGVNISNNYVHDNWDNGIGIIGLNGVTGNNFIADNTLVDNGRFGIEIKNPDGDGSNIEVSGNDVTLSSPFSVLRPIELRDIMGIGVFRRDVGSGNIDVPQGVIIQNNEVSGYIQDNVGSSSEGFGIVVEGKNHVISDNVVTNNDVGIQEQAGHLPYPGNGNQSDVSDEYFGRGNSPQTCNNIFTSNTLEDNTIDTRETNVGGGLVTNTNTGKTFCTIQGAIDDAQTLDGHILVVSPGVYVEQIILNKQLHLRGNNYNINPILAARNAETVIHPFESNPDPNTSSVVTLYLTAAGSGSTIDGFTFDGDNPALISGVLINGADVDAIEAISSYDGVANLLITNNIIKNFSYSGIDLYNYNNGATATSGNVIQYNSISNIAQSPYGIGVLVYNNCYARIEDNHLTNVRVGVQTGNFYRANPGAPATISNNQIETERRGVFHNLSYGAASPFTIGHNVISAVPGSSNVLGISLSSLSQTVTVNVLNNSVTDAYAGVDFWSCSSSNTITVTGGSITNCEYGVVASNYDGYSSNANSSSVKISGVTITGSTIAGVHVKDNPLNSNNATITLEITDDCEIEGEDQLLTGILVTGPDATALVNDNDASIHGFAIGVDVDGGSATVFNNHIYDNGIGVRFINGGNGSVEQNNFDGGSNPDNLQDLVLANNAGAVSPIVHNSFAGSVLGLDNLTGVPVTAINNYWGAANGPSPIGSGVAVSSNVTYCPFLDDVFPIGQPVNSNVFTLLVDENSGNADDDGEICSGDEITLTAFATLPGSTFLWSPGGQITSSIVVNPGVNTLYEVTVTADGGCVETESIMVIVHDNPIFTVSFNGVDVADGADPDDYCIGDIVHIEVAGNNTDAYTIYRNGVEVANGMGNDAGYSYSAVIDSAGTYVVEVITPGGCTSTSTHNLSVDVCAGPSNMEWVYVAPSSMDNVSCPGVTECCSNTFCFELVYTPGVSGVLQSYTTGFLMDCIGEPSPPIISNQSCVMDDNSGMISDCNSDAVLFFSSGNGGTLLVNESIPVVLHKVCFEIETGESVSVTEDFITDLTTIVDLNGGGFAVEFPDYSALNFTKPIPVIPANVTVTVDCPDDVVVPTPPQVLDLCGNVVAPILLSTVQVPNPVTCEGTVTYNYSYEDCSGYAQPWSYTYNVVYEDFVITQPSTGSVVACPTATNVVPTPPLVYDNCGEQITPTYTVSPIPVCEGPRTYTFTYTDCAGFSHDWVYVYVVEYEPFTAPADVTVTVDCPDMTDALPVLPVVTDNCGVILSPISVVVDAKPACSGSRKYTYTYTDCEGNSDLWVFTYIVDVPPIPPVANGGETVDCISDVDPMSIVPPVVTDACGTSLLPVGPSGPFYAPDPLTCEGTVTYSWTYTDCEMNTFVWIYVFTIDQGQPEEVGGPVPTASTISCPLDAIAPVNLPVVQDDCGNVIEAPVPVIGGTNTGDCEGTITYTYTYSNCPGLEFIWVYTYTVSCQQVNLSVFLEGAYNTTTHDMNNTLNVYHVLPGQDKTLAPAPSIVLFAPQTPHGHPYQGSPYLYTDNLGDTFGDFPGDTPYPADVVDWVLVSVRENGVSPAHNIWTCTGWVHENGHVSFPEACDPLITNPANEYYILVQHRNHLGVLSPGEVNVSCGGLKIDWDFTSANSYVGFLRKGQKEIEPGVWAMLAGNGNQVGSGIQAINSADHAVWILIQNSYGYRLGDYIMDAAANGPDEAVWKTNQNSSNDIIIY